MDTKYGFGRGGLPISVLASDQGAELVCLCATKPSAMTLRLVNWSASFRPLSTRRLLKVAPGAKERWRTVYPKLAAALFPGYFRGKNTQ
jgi:hypothetical protein